jgi:sarcosine oxidase
LSNSFETIVVGLGAMGSCALAELARRGVRALGIDRFDPPHDRGSSHGGSRVIRLSYFEHPDYVPLLRRSYECFDRMSHDAGTTLRFETGLLVGGAAGNTAAAGMLRSARLHDLEVTALDGAEVMRRFPQFAMPRDGDAVFERRGGFVRPEATIAAALESAARDGARIERSSPVLSWGSDASGAWVETARGRFEASSIVLCGGAWMRELLGADAPALQPTRETMVWIDDESDPAWQVGTHSNRMPVWLFDRGSEPAVYGIPRWPGMGSPTGLKVGLHGRGPAIELDSNGGSVDAVIDSEVVAQTLATVAHWLPSARARRVDAARHCLYTMSADSEFVLGLHPHLPRVAVACGFSGHGFKFAPVIGEVLADLAVSGNTALPIAFLAPTRQGAGWMGRG